MGKWEPFDLAPATPGTRVNMIPPGHGPATPEHAPPHYNPPLETPSSPGPLNNLNFSLSPSLFPLCTALLLCTRRV